MEKELLQIGRVISVNPARRELRMRLLPGFANQFNQEDWLDLVLPGGESMRCRSVSIAEMDDGTVVARLARGVTRDNTGRMKGATVVVAKARRKDRAPEAFHLSELEGFSVIGQDSRPVGVIDEAYATGPHTGVIEIQEPAGGRILLPAIPEVVAHIDWDAEAVVLGDIEPYAVHERGTPGRDDAD